MLKGLGVVTPRTPDLEARIGAGAAVKANTRAALNSAHSALRLGGAAPSLVIARARARMTRSKFVRGFANLFLRIRHLLA